MIGRLHAATLPLLLGAALAPTLRAQAQPQWPPHDPYFTPLAATSSRLMPRVIVRAIRQDRDGNLWFATFGGPLRYDGEVFTDQGAAVGLPDTRIFGMLVDRSGALWCGSVIDGASRSTGATVTRFLAGPAPQGPLLPTPQVHGLAGAAVHWLHEDRAGNVWFATDGGVSRYDGTRLTNLTVKDGLLHDAVYAIAEDAAGLLWFGTQGGICSYDGKAFVDFGDRVGRKFTNVRAIAVDHGGNLWFGGQDGACRYDGEKLTVFGRADGLLADFVGSILVDRHGHVWFGHPGDFPEPRGGGASRFDGTRIERYTRANGLCVDNVYCMFEDRAGAIWFGSAGAGLCRWDGTTFVDLAEPPRPR